MEKLALSVIELAKALGVSRTVAYELMKHPDFPSARLGKRIVIPVAALNEWLAKGGTEVKEVS